VTKVKLEAAVKIVFQDLGERKGIEDLMVFQVNKVHVVLLEREDTQERLGKMEIQVPLDPLAAL
jgi:hypothetical protein